jgi:hypothetical protein
MKLPKTKVPGVPLSVFPFFRHPLESDCLFGSRDYMQKKSKEPARLNG